LKEWKLTQKSLEDIFMVVASRTGDDRDFNHETKAGVSKSSTLFPIHDDLSDPL
jgi:hypothetical protein